MSTVRSASLYHLICCITGGPISQIEEKNLKQILTNGVAFPSGQSVPQFAILGGDMGSFRSLVDGEIVRESSRREKEKLSEPHVRPLPMIWKLVDRLAALR